MNEEIVVERLFQCLIAGDRTGARQVVADTIREGATAEEFTRKVLWPTNEMVSSLHRKDQLSTLHHHYATRAVRTLIDQVQAAYEQAAANGRTVLVFTGPDETDELAGQIVSDLVEAAGFEVRYAGGGIANDEILAEIGRHQPDVLLMFSSGASDAPNIRVLIDHVREVGACPKMQIVVGGGVFNRASGLAEEIGADAWGVDPDDIVDILLHDTDRRATDEQRTVGRNRKVAPPRQAKVA